jgi:small subunit ribosomal protein S27Ae
MAKKEKKTRKKGKKVRKGRKHESLKVSKYYEVRGESLGRNRDFCPRCGPGVWLSRHKGRLYCGKCGYTSLGGKRSPAEAEPEKKPAEGEAKE